MLVNVCLPDMIEGYKIFLENMSFSSSYKLMEVVWRTNESVLKSSKFKTTVRPSQILVGRAVSKKMPIFWFEC